MKTNILPENRTHREALCLEPCQYGEFVSFSKPGGFAERFRFKGPSHIYNKLRRRCIVSNSSVWPLTVEPTTSSIGLAPVEQLQNSTRLRIKTVRT